VASAGGKISFAHAEVQPGATHFFMIFSIVTGKKTAFDGIRFALVRLLLRSAVLAPKRSKNEVFCVFNIKVQLILAKLVAPYLLC